MRLFAESEISSMPSRSIAMRPAGGAAWPPGSLIWASTPGPSSPLKPGMPVPTTVLMMSMVSTMRIRWLAWSVMYMLPSASKAVAVGRSSRAIEAGPPSPPKARMPLPQIVLRVAAAGSNSISLELCHAAMMKVPRGDTDMCVGWLSEVRSASPSGASPSSPVPTTVCTASASMRRMRWLFQSST